VQTLEEMLEDYMTANGVPADVAENAARNCVQSVARQSLIGAGKAYGAYAVMLGVGAITPPSEAAALSWATMAAALGAGVGGWHEWQANPSCQEVRNAANALASQ
jgi:hypothetical protein